MLRKRQFIPLTKCHVRETIRTQCKNNRQKGDCIRKRVSSRNWYFDTESLLNSSYKVFKQMNFVIYLEIDKFEFYFIILIISSHTLHILLYNVRIAKVL